MAGTIEFVGHEGKLFRAVGMILMVVGLLYLFGGGSGARQVVGASVIDRVTFVPVVPMLLAAAGTFPHTFVTLAILERTLGIGAWVLLNRTTRWRAREHRRRSVPRASN